MSALFGRAAPPRLGLHLRSATLSRAGSYPVNEDAAGEAEAQGCFLHVVADGLGGHAGGEVASRLAVEQCLGRFRAQPALDEQPLRELVLAAHAALRAESAAGEAHDGVRSTLVLLAIWPGNARWAHVGDSRLYHFRRGRLIGRTRDHSVPEMLHRGGEIAEHEIRGHPDRNRLLQVLGQQNPPRVAVSDALHVTGGDAFLLCTDGWWEAVREEEMQTALRGGRTPAEWLERMRHRIEAAEHTVQDNYTAIAVMLG